MGRVRTTAGLVAIGTAGLAAIVATVDPHHPGRFPTCPTRWFTGLDCPACGTMRGLHDLAHGDVLGALDHNLLLALAVPFGLWIWSGWVRTAATGARPRRVDWPRSVAVVALVVVGVFTVARNLPPPAVAWLDAA